MHCFGDPGRSYAIHFAPLKSGSPYPAEVGHANVLRWPMEIFSMPALLLPRSVRKAIDLLRGDLGRPWKINELAQPRGNRRPVMAGFRFEGGSVRRRPTSPDQAGRG
jgi:hypothetical protein